VRDVAWSLFALLWALLAVGAAAGAVVSLVEGDLVRLAYGALFWLPFSVWLGLGAWRRTAWGAPPGSWREQRARQS